MKAMLLSILLFFTFSPASFSQHGDVDRDGITTYFSRYVDSGDFDVVYISGKVFDLINDAELDLEGMEEEEVAAILNVVQDVRGIRILHTDENTMRYHAEAKKTISTDAYDLLFEVRTRDGDHVEAFMRGNDATISELFMLIGGKDTFAMISFVGRIDLSKIGDLQKAMD